MPLRHEVAPCEGTRGLEGRLCRQRSSGRVLTPGPALSCAAGNGGVRSTGKRPRVPVPSGDYRQGAGRTGESREPPLMPRDEWPRDGMCQRGAGTGRCEAAGAGRARHPARASTAVPGVEEAPNPAVSRWCGTWKPRPGPGVLMAPGKPTVRKAQSPGGNRMTRQANAGSRKAAGNRDSVAGPSASGAG
jgi:hypothetical protein